MTATVAIIAVSERADLPPVVRQKIAAFLAAGATGKIVLNVKCGEVRSFELTEVGDARAPIDRERSEAAQSRR